MTTPINQPPDWVADAVFYQIFPDRFASSTRVAKPSNLEPWEAPPTRHGYKGGDLVGIVEHLDYLIDLGINALYLNPIFTSGSNHRYHTYDYLAIDPLLGGDEAFDELMEACHRRGIRVVIDGVFNHCGRGFFPFHDVLENGPQSPWADWFLIEEWPLHPYDGSPPGYAAWWGMAALPKLNTDNPEVADYLHRVGEHWAGKGIDGWRLDVPTEITTDGFWEEFRRRVRAINPDLYIVGEVWEDAGEWIAAGDRFDGTMNYQFGGHTLAFAGGSSVNSSLAEGIPYPVTPTLDAGQYGAAVKRLLEAYPWQAHLANLNLLGSHDTARVLSLVGDNVDAVVMATLLNLTFPGAPCIYYGDEIGLTGGKDPESRPAFPWDQPDRWDSRLLDAHRTLIDLRRDHPVLRRGEYRWITTQDESPLYLFMREDDDERLLIAINPENLGVSTVLEPAPGSQFKTLWGEGGIKSSDGRLLLALPPRRGAVWRVD